MNWRRSIARRLSLALLLAVGLGDAHGRQGPFDERSRDPLTMPRPELTEPLILPVDRRLPADKIVSTMPAAIRLLDDPSSVRVIVTLHEPLGSARSALAQGRQRVDRLARVAALEH